MAEKRGARAAAAAADMLDRMLVAARPPGTNALLGGLGERTPGAPSESQRGPAHDAAAAAAGVAAVAAALSVPAPPPGTRLDRVRADARRFAESRAPGPRVVRFRPASALHIGTAPRREPGGGGGGGILWPALARPASARPAAAAQPTPAARPTPSPSPAPAAKKAPEARPPAGVPVAYAGPAQVARRRGSGPAPPPAPPPPPAKGVLPKPWVPRPW